MGPGYPTYRRSPRGWPPPCPPASGRAGAAPPRPPGAGWRAVTWRHRDRACGAFRKGIPSRGPSPPQARDTYRTMHRAASIGRLRPVGWWTSVPATKESRRPRDAAPGFSAATLWPLSTIIFPTSAGSSGVRSDTLSTSRRYPYPSPSHDPWPGLRPSPDRDVLVRRFLKPVETAPGTLLHDPQHQDGQRFHPRPADPAAPSGQHQPTRKPGQPLSGPFVAEGVLEADQDRRDVVPRPDGRPDPRDAWAPAPAGDRGPCAWGPSGWRIDGLHGIPYMPYPVIPRKVDSVIYREKSAAWRFSRGHYVTRFGDSLRFFAHTKFIRSGPRRITQRRCRRESKIDAA